MENQTTANQIDFNYCKAYNAERIQKIKERPGEAMGGFGVTLCGFENPYKELKNVLAQHYNLYLDMAMARMRESELRKQIAELAAQNNRLISEVYELKLQESATRILKPEYPEPLRELLDQAYPDEWQKGLGDVLDDLIYAMSANTEYNFADSLCTVRELQKFFSGLSNIEQ